MPIKKTNNLKDATVMSSIISAFALFSFIMSWPAILMAMAFVTLMVMKLGGIVAISWWVVTAPIWVPIALLLLVSILIASIVLWLSR